MGIKRIFDFIDRSDFFLYDPRAEKFRLLFHRVDKIDSCNGRKDAGIIFKLDDLQHL